MQAIAICRPKTAADLRLLTQMYRLRAQVFGRRLGWVNCQDDCERDEFDALAPTYILVVDQQDRVVGCARLLPACGPTMLRSVFSALLGDNELHVHRAMVESSRFCVDTSHNQGAGERSVHMATQTMFAAIAQWCFVNGYNEIATVTDVRLERLLSRSGWHLTRLGPPRHINATLSVAGILPADAATFERLRPAGYQSNFSRCDALTPIEKGNDSQPLRPPR